ncbi:E3 UFM1-protein ligase 1 homolog isoform X2 [Diachasma alloeum]|nr:E3 UFM1-protein ligase 1 homolog isoform X2 [Diachasma alloeum]
MVKIVAEISDTLNQIGFINIAELTLHYDLPDNFLQPLVEKALGKTIHGTQDKQDPKIFYTEGFITTNKAKMSGAFFAITKPTPLSAVMGQCNIPEKIFSAILDDLQGSMQIAGVISGKPGSNGIYVPTIYSKNQSEWVHNFYKQNGYLEYDALTRLGLSDAKNFVKRHFTHENLTLLNTVAVGGAIIDQVDANVEDTITTNSFTDIYPLLPSVFTPEDIEALLKESQRRCQIKFHIFATTVIVSEAFLQLLSKPLEFKVEARAKEAVESGKWLQYIAESKIKSSKSADFIRNDKKDERRKKASSGKAGGGSQGRETKTKSTKKKYIPTKNQDYESDDESTTKANERTELILLTEEDIREELNKDGHLSEIAGLVGQLTEYLQSKLNKQAFAMAEQFALATKSNNLGEIEERLNMLITNIKIFDKGIKCISNREAQILLSKYLMKTLGVDFVTDIFRLAAQQNVVQCPSTLTTEARQKMLLELPNDVREPLSNIHKATGKGSVEEFFNAIESTMATCCLVLKKYDKKREKTVILGHKHALLDQLNSTNDPALALHLVTSVLFTATTQSALHMSGRHVSLVLGFLQTQLEAQTVGKLSRYHDLVLTLLSSDNEGLKLEIRKNLEDDLPGLKDMANYFRKQVTADK